MRNDKSSTTGLTPLVASKRTVNAIALLSALATLPLHAASNLALSTPPVAGAADSIVVSLSLTSDQSGIAAVGARLEYDATRVTLVTFALGSGVPATWSFVYQDSTTPGEVDVVLMDLTSAVLPIDTPTDVEVVSLTFLRNDADSTPVNFGFNAVAPSTSAQVAAFPENYYVIAVAGTITVEAATTQGVSGPDVVPCLRDTTDPVVACPPQAISAFADGSCQATVPDLSLLATVSDNCTAVESLSVSQNPAAGSIVDSGLHALTLTVTDDSGNSTVCSVDFVVEDRSFLRGNLDTRTAHVLDIKDLIELVNVLFTGRILTFDCEAALDVSNDGMQNIVDVVALSIGMFRPTAYTIPAPSVVPGVAVGDGGSIASVLSCNEGENCP